MLDRPTPSRFGYAILAALLVFATLAPTLSVPEFSRTLENLNVQTAMEARRDGHWLVPTLEGLPRTKKPPLTAWMTALAIRPSTLAECSSLDPAVRAAAFRKLAWEVRWPALVHFCLAILVVYFLGQWLGVGAEAAIFLASTYLFLRFAQLAQTDIPLTFWVITSNALFAAAVFGRTLWPAAIGAGAAIGVAFMSKGPVALVQSVVPWLIWWLWERPKRSDTTTRRWPHILSATIAGLAVAIPWYLIVLLKDPHRQWHTWFDEVTGSDAPTRSTPFYQYLFYLPEFLPALLFAVPGASGAFKKSPDEPRERSALRLMVCLVLVPLIVQSFFKDKTDRYLLSLVGPMAVLAAVGLRQMLRSRPPASRLNLAGWLYWIALAAATLAFALFAAIGWPAVFRNTAGRPWFQWQLSLAAIALALFLFLAAVRYQSGNATRIATFTMLFMLLFMHLFTLGYYGEERGAQSRMRPLAERIWRQYPTADIFTTPPGGQRASEDLSIYLDRRTGWISSDEMNAATPGDRPKIVLIKQKKTPVVLPPAWKDLTTMPKEEGEIWRIVVLPAK